MRLQAICLKNGNTTIFIAFFIVWTNFRNGNKRRKKQRFEGEIRFILALKYYRMARHFGDIPLIKEKPVSLEEAALPRSPKQEVLDYAIENVNKAIEYLPETYSGDDVGRITKGAALMLKADMYLIWQVIKKFHQGEEAKELWKEAASLAKKVIDLNLYGLENDFAFCSKLQPTIIIKKLFLPISIWRMN